MVIFHSYVSLPEGILYEPITGTIEKVGLNRMHPSKFHPRDQTIAGISIGNCVIYYLVGSIPTPLKNDGVKVSWDYYSQYMESHKNYVPNHQPGRVEYQI